MKKRSLCPAALVSAVALGVGMLAAPVAAGAQTAEVSQFPSVGTDFADEGPYDVDRYSTTRHTYYYPEDVGDDGLRHPVILWGNGTGATPTTYASLLRHLASHGFIVAAADTRYAGSGARMLQGLDNLEDYDGRWFHRFSGAVDLDRVAATGHSQGGGGAIQAGHDPRVDTIFPLQPWTGDASELEIPSLFFAGEDDRTVTPRSVRRKFNAAQGPAVYAELAGAGHFVPVGSAGDYRGPATAWARWYLMDDENAASVFVGDDCDLCDDGWFADWSDYQTNDAFDAAPGQR